MLGAYFLTTEVEISRKKIIIQYLTFFYFEDYFIILSIIDRSYL